MPVRGFGCKIYAEAVKRANATKRADFNRASDFARAGLRFMRQLAQAPPVFEQRDDPGRNRQVRNFPIGSFLADAFDAKDGMPRSSAVERRNELGRV
jgi:hypothetical protein